METNKWELKISAQFGNRTHVKENGKQIFVIEHYCDTDTEKREIENKIQKAVNSHEELVNGLKDAQETINNLINATPTGETRNILTYANIKALTVLQKVNNNT